MSLGFSVGDITTAVSIVKHTYDRYNRSPNGYIIFSREVRQVCDNFKKAQELRDNSQWSTEDKTTLDGYISDIAALSEDLSAFAKKYRGLANGSGRTLDRIRWPEHEVEQLRQHIVTYNSSLSTFLVLILSRESSDRESYEPSVASSTSDRRTHTSSGSTSQDACDEPRMTKSRLFDGLGSNGSSLNAGFGGGPFIPSTKKSVKGVEASTAAQRTLSAGEADQPKPGIPKKKAASFSLGSSSPSLAQVRSPFGQGNSGPRKPSSQHKTNTVSHSLR
ncbi:hypothetical protein MMC22_002646 [Lobaria immixta]|nr:hypothetical protein [Lobaria immixta]